MADTTSAEATGGENATVSTTRYGPTNKFTYSLTNFSACPHTPGDGVYSNPFQGPKSTHWALVIYPRGASELEDKWLGLYLKRLTDVKGPKTVKVWARLSLGGSEDDIKLYSKTMELEFERGEEKGLPEYIMRTSLFESGYLAMDTLRVIVQYRMEDRPRQMIVTEVRSTLELSKGTFDWHIAGLDNMAPEPDSHPLQFEGEKEAIIQAKVCIQEKDEKKLVVFKFSPIGPLLEAGKAEKVSVRLTVLDGQLEPSGPCKNAMMNLDPSSEETWDFPHSFLLSELVEFLYCGMVRIRVEACKALDNRRTIVVKETSNKLWIPPQSKIREEFAGLLANAKNTFSDVTLRACDGDEIPAHKAFLAQHSPRLAELLNAAPEAMELELDDIDGPTLRQLVYFAYTGQMVVDEEAESEAESKLQKAESARKVHKAAFDYRMPQLRSQAVLQIRRTLGVASLCHALDRAYESSDADLWNACIEHFADRWLEIALSPTWNKFLVEKPLVAQKANDCFRTDTLLF